MAKIVQRAGGPANQEDNYTGPDREIRIDISNKEMRLHDGVTKGGHRFLMRDAMDERYQQRSAELDGLADFSAASRGFLARIADGVYRLRKFVGTTNQIEVTNDQGVDGNPTFKLSATQDGEHVWNDQQQFKETVKFDNGILGNLEGDTSGTHTGPVTGDVTGDLTGDSTGTHTGPQIGDVDVRGKNFQAGEQITYEMLTPDAKAKIIASVRNLMEPIGKFPKLYIGAIQDIPEGYAVCDGTNGTPDFRNRIPMGYSDTFAILATKGATTHTHSGTTEAAGAHTHALTITGTALTVDQMPAHSHLNGVVDADAALFNHGSAAATPPMGGSIDGNSAAGVVEGRTTTVGTGATHTHTGSTANSSGAHNHGFTAPASDHTPPVIGVAFIVRIS